MLSTKKNIGIVILAAGKSSRYGSPKQLLPYNGKSLLQHSISEAINTEVNCVMVVLGANAGLLEKEIDKSKVTIVENKEWEEGMASSIRTGLSNFLEITPQAEAVIFLVCDQPFVTTVLLNQLIRKHSKTGKPIVAANYGDTIGVPALFHKSIFNDLMKLKGDTGARKIIQQHKEEVETISFPMGNVDIDKKEDYEKLLNP